MDACLGTNLQGEGRRHRRMKWQPSGWRAAPTSFRYTHGALVIILIRYSAQLGQNRAPDRAFSPTPIADSQPTQTTETCS